MKLSIALIPVGIFVGMTLGGCTPLPVGKSPSAKDPKSFKPTAVSRVQILEKSLREFGRLERPLNVYFATQGLDEDEHENEHSEGIKAAAMCVTKTVGGEHLEQTQWKCGTDQRERGRKEIIGTETIDYKSSEYRIEYTANLTITQFSDLEPRERAHATEIRRHFAIDLSQPTSASNITGRVTGYSRAAVRPKTGSTENQETNFEIKWNGQLRGSAKSPRLVKGALISFSGSYWGEDERQGTPIGGGSYSITALDDVPFLLSAVDTCRRPVGSWKFLASGGGASAVGSAVSSLDGVSENEGLAYAWQHQYCSRP